MRSLIQFLVLVGVGVALWRLFVEQGGEIRVAAEHLGLARLAVSFGLASTALWCAWRSWYSILRAGSITLGHGPARRLYFVSQLGKYVPGAVWPVVMQGQTARSYGIRRLSLVSSYVAALLVSTATGVAVAGAALLVSERSLLQSYWWMLIPALASLSLLTPRALPYVLSVGMRLLGRAPFAVRMRPRYVAHASLWSLGTWSLLGLHVAVLAGGLVPFGPPLIARATGSMALAFVAGMLFVVAPAGVGVREVVLVAALGPIAPPLAIVTIILASRVLMVLADIVAAIVAELLARRPMPSKGIVVKSVEEDG